MKRTYEALYILKPTLLDEEVNEFIDSMVSLATENGAEVLSKGKWDKRRLAYEINHYKEGIYCLMYVIAEGNIPAVLTRAFRISDDVIRGMITVVNTKYVDTSKIERPKALVEETRETVVPAPVAVIPDQAELEQVKTGEAEPVVEAAPEVVEATENSKE